MGVLAGAPDAAVASLGAAIHAWYHWQLCRREAAGHATWRGEMAANRAEWAGFVVETSGWLYAVQTLRNAITANTVLATAMLSLFSIVRTQIRQARFTWRLLLQWGSVAWVITSLCLLRSAYEFLQSARLMTHAGFMFPTTAAGEEADGFPTKTDVEKLMVKSEMSQWAGLCVQHARRRSNASRAHDTRATPCPGLRTLPHALTRAPAPPTAHTQALPVPCDQRRRLGRWRRGRLPCRQRRHGHLPLVHRPAAARRAQLKPPTDEEGKKPVSVSNKN